jgi:hypothetical protein
MKGSVKVRCQLEKIGLCRSRLLSDGDSTPNEWCAADKFATVVETVSMNEAELSSYCRERGLYAEQRTRNWTPVAEVWPNPDNPDENGADIRGKAA